MRNNTHYARLLNFTQAYDKPFHYLENPHEPYYHH